MALTPEQKRFRLLGYGSSEVATIVGVGYGSIEQVYADKVHPLDAEAGEDENLPADLGTLLEEPVAQIYARRIDRVLIPVGSLQHPTRPLAIATPDRAAFDKTPDLDPPRPFEQAHPLPMITRVEQLAGAERLVEVKTTAMRYRGDYGAAGSSEVPEEKAIQCIWQMAVTGLRLVDLPVLFIGEWSKHLDAFHIGFNAKLFDLLYEAVERFDHDFVKAKRPPPPDGSARYDAFQKRAYPINLSPPKVATAAEEELMLLYAKLSEAEGRLEKARKLCRQKLVDAIGESGGLVSALYGTLTYKKVKDSTEINWSKATNEALTLAGLVIEHMPDGDQKTELAARVRAIITENTSTKVGYRRLNATWAGDASLELKKLNLMIDAFEEPQEP